MSSILRTMQKPGMVTQWTAHCGRAAQIRNLKHLCAPVMKLKGVEHENARARVRVATQDEPHPEYGMMSLIASAIDAAAQTGEPWYVCMNYFLDKYDAQV